MQGSLAACSVICWLQRPCRRHDDAARPLLAVGSAIAAVERLCQLQMLLQRRQRLLSEGLERGILP